MAANPLSDADLQNFLAKNGVVVVADTWVKDWTDKIPEFQSKKLIWIVDSKSSRSIIVVALDGADWHQLNLPDYELFNRGLRFNSISDSRSVMRMVRVTGALMYDPRFIVCDSRLANSSDDFLSSYIVNEEFGIDALRKICNDQPKIELQGTTWVVELRILDFTGSIKKMRMSGTQSPVRLNEISFQAVTPEGSFFLADEF